MLFVVVPQRLRLLRVSQHSRDNPAQLESCYLSAVILASQRRKSLALPDRLQLSATA